MILKIFICHYNSERHNELIPSLTIHTMNKIQVVESLFHRYPNKMTLDMKYFCQQSTIFLSFAQVFSRWNMNKVQEGYSSFRTKPLDQICYENYVLGLELMSYIGDTKREIPYFIRVIEDKHFDDVYKDIERYKRKEGQIASKYKMASLQNLLPPIDYTIPDQVHLKIWNVANLPL